MSDTDHIYQGLQSLAETAFPKRCRNCGRLYHDVSAFIAETKLLNAKHSGLKPAIKDDGSISVELFRNCPCGSTLMDVFNNRRDISQNGIKRRNDCDKMMDMMQKEYNVTKDAARAELLKIMSGEPGDIVKNILPTRNPSK
ncbi:MAG: hypothetical protein ACJAUP_000188 [Cellvibrionaceae bacterium]|jgi:hypothetical protein